MRALSVGISESDWRLWDDFWRIQQYISNKYFFNIQETNIMKVTKLIQQLYAAIAAKNTELQKKLYEKITRKSLKKKNTQAVQ